MDINSIVMVVIMLYFYDIFFENRNRNERNRTNIA